MEESVQTSVALHHSVSELVVVFGDSLFEVEQRDDRLRPTCRFDLRMDGFELRELRPIRITFAPYRAQASATARPIPLLAPVMAMTRPVSSSEAATWFCSSSEFNVWSIPLIESTQAKVSGSGPTRSAPSQPPVREGMIPAR